MTLNKITIRKVKNGFLLVADYDRLLGKNHSENYVFGSFENAVAIMEKLLDTDSI